MPIRLLSPEVASQIAAGEVIERPASVVKELVENALDAGARSISITIENAGRDRIEVADDGCGIPPDELELSISRHATSKLVEAQELFSISSLGFRGEALASIASVSRLTIASRVEARREGARLHVQSGRMGKLEQIGLPVGTQVQVEDLFYNVPARLKFLKTTSTERRVIASLITRYALAYPHVRIKFSERENINLQTTGDGNRRAILAELYDVEIAKKMLEVVSENNGLKITGFISPISLTRSNRREITFFVNGRWVQDVSLNAALVQAYHTLLMVGRYPIAMLFLELAPDAVDVNVHPAKTEIRFRDPDEVFSFVQRATRRALLAYMPVPQISHHIWGQPGGAPDPAWSLAHATDQSSDPSDPSSAVNSLSIENADLRSPTDHISYMAGIRQTESVKIPLLRLVGQIGATYVVAEGPDGLYLIDQHAAHERVLFEKLMAAHAGKKIATQVLLAPVVLNLPPAQASVLGEYLVSLNQLGFEVVEFGTGAYQIRALPALFNTGDPVSALRAVVEEFEEDETPLLAEVEARLAGRVCRRMAVKAGQVLSLEEQKNLLADLESCASPRTCPHGRPTMIHLSVDVLERQFGRRGAR